MYLSIERVSVDKLYEISTPGPGEGVGLIHHPIYTVSCTVEGGLGQDFTPYDIEAQVGAEVLEVCHPLETKCNTLENK